jgi:uncharacterized metal-binding protein YceD (DUF177 family)
MSKRQNNAPINEWSDFMNGDRVDNKAIRTKIEANEEQRKNVSVRANIPAISALNADLTIEREQFGRVVHVAGRFNATITLLCSITAEKFEFEIEEPVEGWFADKESTVSFMRAVKERDGQQVKGGVEVEVTSEAEDPEDMINGQIDLGELVVQHLILAIPPYPRKDGVEHDLGDEAVMPSAESPLRKNPFEALKDWKEKR